MTQEEFENRFRGRMALFITEAWAVRKESPSDMGLVLDIHFERGKALLREMYKVLTPEQKPPVQQTARK